MGSSSGRAASQRGITGLETAIILIAFVVVASVFAFTVLSTGVFASERGKETIFAGLTEAQSSMQPRGSNIVYTGYTAANVRTVYKVSVDVSLSIGGEPVDLTPPYTSDDASTDPDVASANKPVTVISYSDKNQFLSDVPWTVTFPGDDDGDNILEGDEKAEIVIWLLDRNTATAIGSTGSIAVMDGTGDGGGTGGFDTNATLLAKGDEFNIKLKPPTGAVLDLQRQLPSSLDTVMDLN